MFCDVVLLLFMLFSASSMLEIHMLVAVFVMFNILELIMEIMPSYLTIQKPYFGQFPELTFASFVDAMRPESFKGTNFKRWQVRCQLWL